MNRKPLHLFMGIVLLMFSTEAQAEAVDLVRIGVVTDLSGQASYLGQQVRLGAEMAAEEIRLNGGQVDVFFGDHGLDTKKAVTEAQKVININNVDAVLTNFTAPSRAMSPIVYKRKRLFLYTAAAQSPVRSNLFSFKSYIDYRQGCLKVAQYWKSEGIVKLGFLKPEAEFGDLCLEGARAVYPDLVYRAYTVGEEVMSQVLFLKTKGVEAILNASYRGDIINLLKALKTLQYKPHIGINEDSLNDELWEDFELGLEGMLSFGIPLPSKAFLDRVKERDPSNNLAGIEHLGMGYLHVRQIYEAVAACPHADVSCQVAKLSQASSYPELGFLGWKERIAQFDIFLKLWKSGASERVYVK